MTGTSVEALLRRERLIVCTALIVISLLAWLWIIAGAGTGMSTTAMTTWDFPPPRPTTAMPAQWSALYWLTMLFMWWVMMIAMMVPSTAPLVFLYARVVRHAQVRGRMPEALVPITAFVAGYLACWLAFSALATMLQFALERAGAVDGMMMWSTEHRLSAALLIVAGLYQFSPLKTACLAQCRSPVDFLAQHYRPGRNGAFRLGVVHGAYCLGCCWAIMLLLFAAGIMNLVWIAGLSIIVLIEKLAPFGTASAKLTGTIFMLGGIWLASTS